MEKDGGSKQSLGKQNSNDFGPLVDLIISEQ